MHETINWKIKDQIGYLSFTSPPQNMMGPKFFFEFSTLINSIKSSSELKGLIIFGENRHFSSGTNIEQLFKLFTETNGGIPDSIKQNSRSFINISELHFPVVSAVTGVCLGSAFELALSSHFRIAASNAIFGLPESSFDILPGLGGIQNMYHNIGKAKTMELVLSGDLFSADEALKMGLIDFLAHKKEIIPKAESLINSIGNNFNQELKNNYLRVFCELKKDEY